MDNKKSGGDKIKNLIKTFEDFKKVISKEVNIKIGEKDGDPIYNTYIVHAVSPKRLAEVRGNYQNSKPPYPLKSKGSDGVEREGADFVKKLAQYKLDIEVWNQKEVCYLILAGWVEPNEIELEGKTDEQRVDYIFNNMGVAGHLNILAIAIEEVSALTGADVNFM